MRVRWIESIAPNPLSRAYTRTPSHHTQSRACCSASLRPYPALAARAPWCCHVRDLRATHPTHHPYMSVTESARSFPRPMHSGEGDPGQLPPGVQGQRGEGRAEVAGLQAVARGERHRYIRVSSQGLHNRPYHPTHRIASLLRFHLQIRPCQPYYNTPLTESPLLINIHIRPHPGSAAPELRRPEAGVPGLHPRAGSGGEPHLRGAARRVSRLFSFLCVVAMLGCVWVAYTLGSVFYCWVNPPDVFIAVRVAVAYRGG